jgi:hypothetical protein
MALGSTQPLTEMSTACISWGGKGGRCVMLTTLQPSCAFVMKSGNLNFLEPSGPLQACNGTALPLMSGRRGTKFAPDIRHIYPSINFYAPLRRNKTLLDVIFLLQNPYFVPSTTPKIFSVLFCSTLDILPVSEASDKSMCLGSTQPFEMSTRIFLGVKTAGA